MKSLIRIAALVLGLSSIDAPLGSVNAAMLLTGNNLLDYCSAPKDTPQELICKAWIKGAYEMQFGLQLQATILHQLAKTGNRTVEPPNTGICIPNDVTSDEIYEVAIAKLRRLGAAGNILTAGQMIGEAWRTKWPCPSHIERLKSLDQSQPAAGDQRPTCNGNVCAWRNY